jgi:hypothetical protein
MEQCALVLGLARSGTTWVAKVLDSHPDVTYVHEPDVLPGFTAMLPTPAAHGNADAAREAALYRALRHMDRVNQAGSWPVFRKRGEPLVRHACRQAAVFATRGASRRFGNMRLRGPARAPGDVGDGSGLLLWKSVQLLGRVAHLAESMPRLRIVCVIRHPCAVIASRRRGVRQREMAPLASRLLLADLEAGARVFPSLAGRVDVNSVAELEAFRWAYLNSVAVDAGAGPFGDRVRIVRHEDLLAGSVEGFRSLTEYLGLDWSATQTRFLRHSAQPGGRFYGLRRSPEQAGVWTRELPEAEQRRIMELVSGTPAGQCYAGDC